jgi:phage terminase large subunit GpA-like protein
VIWTSGSGWLADKLEAVTTSLPTVTPSEWAEQNRWLPRSVSNVPGYYSFNRTPYLREIVDCLGVESPVREVSLEKGAQVGATTGVENGVGYCIGHLGSVPILWVTADQEMATQRLQANINPMIQQSGLSHRIQANDNDGAEGKRNKRRTGNTSRKIEFVGGGSLRPLGAQNANKFRQDSAQYLIRDEIDGWPETVGKDGDPLALTETRTAAFEDSRKIFDLSTPTILGLSKIHRRFLRGDQRYYFVNCMDCAHPQTLRWRHKPHPETGVVGGIYWETDRETGQLVPGSVRYHCEKCGHPHRNEDKTQLLDPNNGAQWVPTATPVHPSVRSYHLSALYSPVGMQSWEACVTKWLDAWDVENARPRDMGLLQAFYNNVLGVPFELTGDKLRFDEVSSHRRQCFRFGEVPNKWASDHAGSPIQVITCAVDVQKTDLAVGVFGWSSGRRSFLLNYWRFEGPTDNIEEPTTWKRLSELIEQKVYVGDDGKAYRIALTLIDTGYQATPIYTYVAQYAAGVVAIKGESSLVKSVSGKLFTQIHTPLGERGFGVNVDAYKERLHLALKRGWDRTGVQPEGHFNCPVDALDEQLKELTVEKRVEEIDPRTRQRRGWKWVRPGGSHNELWDLMVYASAGLDMLAWDYCRGQLELEQVSWPEFWAFTARGAYFAQQAA